MQFTFLGGALDVGAEVDQYYVCDGQLRMVIVGPTGSSVDLPASHVMLGEAA
ncbi:hypothetical protein ACIGPN_06070 [Streptomyces afghaniensis]|uniref:hypothetical protein n=1 Tax=Streptomyces afghaniensis TaxID=66865 RepID=UPI0037D0667C